MKKWIFLIFLLPMVQGFDAAPTHDVTFAGATAVDIAENGAVIMGKNDPRDGDNFEDDDAPVWVIFNRFGQQVRTGDADDENCTGLVVNPCIAHVVDVRISADGTRAVVAANNLQGRGGQLVFITDSQGEFEKIHVSDHIRGLHANEDISTIIIGTYENQGPGSNGGIIGYNWGETSTGAAGSITQSWTHNADDDLLMVDGHGTTFVAASETEFFRVLDGELDSYDLPKPAVAVTTKDAWSAVSLDDGRIRLYGPDSTQTPHIHSWEFHSTSQQSTLLEFSPDQKRLLAASDVLRTYANPVTDPDATRIQTVENRVPISAEWNGFEQTLGYEDGVEVRFNHTLSIWMDSHENPVKQFLGQGDVFAAFVGDDVHVYKPAYQFEVETTPALIGFPDETAQANWTISNQGNRIINVQATYEGAMAVEIPDATLLFPGESKDFTVELEIPADAQAQEFEGSIRFEPTGEGATTKVLDVAILETPGWILTGGTSVALSPGQEETVSLLLTNTGNAANETNILLETSQEWLVSANVAQATVPAGASIEVNITLEAPLNAAHLDEIDIEVIIPGFASHAIHGVVGGVYGVGLQGDASEPVTLGGITTVTLTVENKGNIDDGYVLSFQNVPNGWLVQAQPTNNVLVPAGQVRDVDVQIITAATSSPANYQITAKATSASENTIAATALFQVPAFAESETESESSSSTPAEETPIPLWLALSALLIAFHRRK